MYIWPVKRMRIRLVFHFDKVSFLFKLMQYISSVKNTHGNIQFAILSCLVFIQSIRTSLCILHFRTLSLYVLFRGLAPYGAPWSFVVQRKRYSLIFFHFSHVITISIVHVFLSLTYICIHTFNIVQNSIRIHFLNVEKIRRIGLQVEQFYLLNPNCYPSIYIALGNFWE